MNKSCLLLLALSLGAAVPTMVSCERHGERTQEAAQADMPAVSVYPIQQRDVTDFGEWFGYVRGEMDTDIHPHVTGTLAEQVYENGAYVQAGDVLFRIDPAIFEAQLAEAEANLKAAEASVTSAVAAREKAELDVKRYEDLGARVVSEKTLTDARHGLNAALAAETAAKAAEEQAHAALDKARINLEYTVIRAPYNGVVGTAAVSQGAVVSPATKLANISAVDTMRALFSINGANMISVFRKYGDVSQNRDKVEKTPFYLVLEDGETYPITGRFSALESIVEPNGVINAEARFENPAHTLRTGMPVRVRVPKGAHSALLVPAAAIRTVMRNRFILVTDKAGAPHMVPVTVGASYPVTVQEADGYTSEQQLTEISAAGTPLDEIFRRFGYENATEVPVVADEQNGVLAMNISSANSRLGAGEQPVPLKTKTLSFRPVVDPALAAAAKAAEEPQKAAPANVKPTMPPFPVKVLPLQLQRAQVPGEWFGTLRGVEETDIRPQVSGFLISQQVEDGRMVKKGDVLFEIDPAPYQAALHEAQANAAVARAAVAQAETQAEMNRTNYERYNRLVQEAPGTIAEKTLTDAATAVKTAEAAVLKARAASSQADAAVKMAEINLGYTTIRAPFDGRVGIHKPSVGALVSPQDLEPLVTISSVNPIRVDFSISGKDALLGISTFAKACAAGKDAGADIPLEILLEDGSLYPAKGHIVNADNSLNTATGTLLVSGQLENTDGGLRSGMPVRVRADFGGSKPSILVPARAPLSAQGRDILVMLKPDNSPQMLPIKKKELVVVPVKQADGSEAVQPMQMIDIDREMVTAMILMKAQAPSAEALVLGQAQVADWSELLLKNAGVADFRTLAEKTAGHALPDEAPASIGAADWKDFVLRSSGHGDFRSLVLQQADAQDELALIARAQGFETAFEMVLKQMGYDSLDSARVVVEGSIMAAQVYQANMAAGYPVNTLTPVPFLYTPPKTVVDSVTADEKN